MTLINLYPHISKYLFILVCKHTELGVPAGSKITLYMKNLKMTPKNQKSILDLFLGVLGAKSC